MIRQRHAIRRREDAVMMQMTIGSVFDPKAAKHLAKVLKRLDQSA